MISDVLSEDSSHRDMKKICDSVNNSAQNKQALKELTGFKSTVEFSAGKQGDVLFVDCIFNAVVKQKAL